MPPLDFTAADRLPAEAPHAAHAAAFADYVVPGVAVPLAAWSDWLARQGVALSLSRAACDAHGQVMALVLVAPRPACRRWRIATAGARPATRGTGVAPALVADVLRRAAAVGCVGVELEVVAQNSRAVALYQRLGFARRGALHGHELPAGAFCPPAQPAVRAVPLDRAGAWLARAECTLDPARPLPMQMGPLCLQAPAAGLHAWQSADGAAQLVVSETGAALRLRSLVDLSGGQTATAALCAAAQDAPPGQPLRVPPLLRDDLGGAALRAHGRLHPLHQWWMCHDLGR